MTQICYVTVPGNKPGERIGIVKFREPGYYLTNYDRHQNIEDVKEHVRLINEAIGVSPEVAESALGGSMFGWNTPSAEAAIAHFSLQAALLG